MIYINKKYKKQSGQALLAVILVIVVALTVGLSVATRNITNLRLSNDEQSSQRALSAAEAGIEQALELPNPTGTIIGAGGLTPTRQLGNSNIETVKITSVSATEMLLNGGNPIPKDEGIDIWLSSYGSLTNSWSGKFNIYWHTPTSTCTTSADEANTAALDVYVVFMPISGVTKSDVQVYHYPIDPCATRRASNSFCPKIINGSQSDTCNKPGIPTIGDTTVKYVTTSYSIDGKSFSHQLRISMGDPGMLVKQNGVMVRITPLYADEVIGIRTTDFGTNNVPLPAQAKIIESTGSSGDTKRKISVYRANPSLPNELFYSIFSP